MPTRIDYERMSSVIRAQRSALTRAQKAGDLERMRRVCRAAVHEWNSIGAWPDDWCRWQIALNDLEPWRSPTRLEDL